MTEKSCTDCYETDLMKCAACARNPKGVEIDQVKKTMPDIKEKLVELVCDALDDGCGRHCKYMPCARVRNVIDALIANGVTIQKWISVEERLPTEADADDVGAVLAIHKAARKKYYHWRSVADNPFDFTHWMPLPEPPKGE